MRWLDFLMGRTRAARRPATEGRRAPPLSVERLEPRTMLNASTSLVGGILYVTCGGNRDRLDVALDTTTAQLIVSDSGTEVGRYASAQVSSLAIGAGAGTASVQVEQTVLQPALIQGGAGDMVLQAGGGPTTIEAGDGNVKLIGGPAANVLVGGAGFDTFVSKSGQDTIQTGSGQNLLFVRGNSTILGAAANTTIIGQQNAAAASPAGDPPPLPPPALSPDPPGVVLTPADVNSILLRAAAADPADDAIVAVVDRQGRLLGVRVEGNVPPAITSSNATLSFAIDGALAEARTGAFFGNANAPLTSRTIQFISQSTITQREVDSNPNITDPSSTVAGPGFVAPIGIGAHFPPNVSFTPQVDLYNIEASNRDTSAGLIDGNGRFNTNPAFIPAGADLAPPDAYGTIAGLPGGSTQGRGIGTLPGGVPIYKTNPANGQLVVVGGIGVFFPGTTGYASAENSVLSAGFDPTKPDRSLEAELVAVAAVGGSTQLFSSDHQAPFFGDQQPGQVFFPLNAVAPLPGFNIPVPPPGRIDLVGITLDVIGPGGLQGPDELVSLANKIGFGTGNPFSGVNEPVMPGGMPCDPHLAPALQADCLATGKSVAEGWLVTPHASNFPGGLTAAQVTQIIDQGIAEAGQIRAAIRLPLDSTAKMVFAVADLNGDILGLYRMPDATVFSIDVAVAKARNVAYYANPALLQPEDMVPGIPAGVAFTNRTFRYLADARFPEGIDGQLPGPFSILNDGGTNPSTGLNVGPPLPASAFTSVQGYDAFHPGTNFRDPLDPQFQNGVIFFPGSAPLYGTGGLELGGLGVSGDGVDQDDDITFFASNGFQPSAVGVARSDQYSFDGVRLPYQKFNRNPVEPV
jgi:uncharacterized protein GlcG (DUF336 family)